MKLFYLTILVVILSVSKYKEIFFPIICFNSLLWIIYIQLAFASKSPEDVESEVLAYVQSQVNSVLRKPAVARSGGGLACYDKYIPMITAATEDSKSDTATCNARATSRRQDELNKVKEQRDILDIQVKTVQDALASCVNQEDALNFLICFRDNVS